MDLMKQRRLILIASCLVALCIGSSYAWSAFAYPMGVYLSEILGYDVGSLAIVFTIANSVGPITMISSGFINDKLGPKTILLVGGLMFGGGMFFSGFVKSVGMLIVTCGLFVGLANGMVYGAILSNSVKFFPDRGGFAGGLIAACYGASSIIMPPIANALAEAYHVTNAFKIIGAVMGVIICASVIVIKRCPPDFKIGSVSQKAAVPAGRDYSSLEMLKTSDCYVMLLTLTCGAFAGLMVISQASLIAQRMIGVTPAFAAVVVSLVALFNAIGRLCCGAISDRIGTTGTLRVTFAASMVAGVILYFCTQSTVVLFCICLAVIGFCFGSIMGTYPGFTAQRFGRRNNSVNYGIMFIGFALAGLMGPTTMSSIYRTTGTYQPAFLVSAALAIIGEILIVILRRSEKRRASDAAEGQKKDLICNATR